MSNDIVFKLSGRASSLAINFRYEDSRIEGNKSIPQKDIKIIAEIGKLTIKLDVGKSGNTDVATWYNNFVNNDSLHMVHTDGGGRTPDKLNFALKGWLAIGDVEYHVCFGQGHYGSNNNWHLCSMDILARGDNKSAYLNNIYYVGTSGSYGFDFIYSDEINSGKGISLWAYTGSESVTPRYDLEGDSLHPFVYQKSNLAQVGTMQKGKAYDTSGIKPLHREFHLQLISKLSNFQLTEEVFLINRETGTIGGKTVFEQTARTVNDASGTPFVMNYGVSHAAQPLTDQSYLYTGPKNCEWMKTLAGENPDLHFRDLVLPGSHDAGMYEINIDVDTPIIAHLALTFLALIFPVCSTEVNVILGKFGINIALANLGATQKDNAYQQMVSGTRYFDFRPAYLEKQGINKTYHYHNFIPGVLFSDFLQGMNQYLAEFKNEVAVINISDSGIDRNFTCLSENQVNDFLTQYISPHVGYEISDSFDSYNDQTLRQVAANGKRLIVLYDTYNVNDSYNDVSYSDSLTDPAEVIKALNTTVKQPGNHNFTVLQLQNTGSSALRNYIGKILDRCTSWANDVLGSETGNILQATKPIFDHATYQWLTNNDVIAEIGNQHGVVVIQNDFVDIALSAHAIALSKSRYKNRK